MSNRIQSVDGLRLFLFLGIFLFHAWGEYFPVGWGGGTMFLIDNVVLPYHKAIEAGT